jgi:ubiquinone biosynthesis protein COQ9
MLDDFSNRNRAIRAALDLAAERGWDGVTFIEIADRTGLSLADLRREFTCKTDLLKAFQAEVDVEVLAKMKPATEDQSPRDRLFDLIMTRFEVMAPYKQALDRIHAALRCHPREAAQLFCSTLASQYWMLAGAGAKLGGPGTGLRVAGLTAIYGKVFHVWLDDPSPGLDRTMAALDRRLQSGEHRLAVMETVCGDVCRLACGFLPRGWKRRSENRGSAEQAPGGPSATPASA